jgi:hypothetical protein
LKFSTSIFHPEKRREEDGKTKLIYVSFQTKQNIYLFASKEERKKIEDFSL